MAVDNATILDKVRLKGTDDYQQRVPSATQTGVAHCPASNMKLSSGVCRVPDMLKLDIPLGLAVADRAFQAASRWLSLAATTSR